MTIRFLSRLALAGGLVSGAASAAFAGGEATFGSQWWDQTAPDAKYQEFRQVPRGAFLESFVLQDWSGRNAWLLTGANAMRADQAAAFSWSNGVRWRMDLDYLQIPHNFSFVSHTPYTEAALGVFVLPDTLQRINQENPSAYASTMSDLLKASARLPVVGFRTDVSKARLRARPARGWQFEVRGTQRERAGSKPYGASFGFNNAIELLEPIRQRTVDADAIASYVRDRVSVQASAGLSQFDNGASTLRWDNPKRLTDRTSATAYVAGDGSAAGRLDLYPDNRAIRGNVALGLQLPRRTAFSASLGLSRYTQDDDWLPMTVNSAIAQSSLDSLPARSTDAEATRLVQDYRLVSRAWPRLAATLRLHHDRYENKTPEYTFNGQVRLDQTLEPERIENHPFGNQQLVLGADLDYDIVRGLKLGGTYELRHREHTLREVEKDDENVFGARARVRPAMMSGVEIQADYRHGERELDEFEFDDYRKDENPDSAFIEQPNLRRFDVADRRQDWARAGVSLPVGERVTVYAGYTFLHNDYHRTVLGLQDDQRHSVTATATMDLSEQLDLSGGYGFDQVETEQQSRESGAVLSTADTTNWTAKPKDRNQFAFATVEWQPQEKWTFIASYEFSQAKGEYPLANFKGTAQSLPDTRFQRHEVVLEARLRLMAESDVALRYGFEEYDVTDFASENVPLLFPVTGTSNAIFLGDSSIDYRAHRVALIATRRF